MSQAMRSTNGTGSPTNSTPSHYTLVTHTSTQKPLQPANVSSVFTTREKANMNQAAPDSSPLSSVPDSLHLSVKSVTSTTSARHMLPTPRPSDASADGDVLPESSTTTELSTPTGPAPSVTEDCAKKQAPKRSCTDNSVDDTLPAPKRSCTDNNVDDTLAAPKRAAKDPMVKVELIKSPAQTKTPTGHTSCKDQYDLAKTEESVLTQEAQLLPVAAETTPVLNQGEPAEPEEPTKKSKTRSKAVSKGTTSAPARRRACDTCKRRKVKCNHNSTEEKNNDRQSGDGDLAMIVSKDHGSKDELDDVVKAEESLGNAKSQVDMRPDYEEPTELAKAVEPARDPKTKKKTASRTPAAPPARASTRNRKAPERLEDLEETTRTKPVPVKKGASKVFDPVFITTNSTSRLGKADMYHMLLESSAWTSLSAEQQATLVSMLPDTTENQQLLARIKAGETDNTRPHAFTVSNDCFRTDVAKFQADLKNGHLAKTWQAAAEQAVIERAAGEYDAWKAEESELWWGQKSK